MNPLDPQSVPKRAPKVKTINKIPVFIALAVVLSFLVMMAITASQKSNRVKLAEDEKKSSKSADVFATALTAGRDVGGVIPPAEEKPKEPDKKVVPVAIIPPKSVPLPQQKSTIPTIPERQQTSRPPEDIANSPRYKMLQGAVMSKTNGEYESRQTQSSRSDSRIDYAAYQPTGTASGSTDVTDMYVQRLNALKKAGLIPADAMAASSSSAPPSSFGSGPSSGSDAYSKFGGNEGRWELGNTVSAPESKYTIRAGTTVIPAILISGINSDLPGQVQAQVSQNVYDTPTGKYLLLPQGTRLVGQYDSSVAYGQERVLMAWQRIIFPDGRVMDLGAIPGADSAGFSGFKDKVHTHFWKTIGSAFLMSGVIAGVTLSQDNDNDSNSDSTRASDALSEALGQTLGNTLAQMIQKNMNLSPTLEIRPGYRLNVMVTKDLVFERAYRPFDY